MASAAFEDIVDTFEFLEDWEARYTHVIEMGKELPHMEDALKGPLTKVDGCASQVWLSPEVDGTGSNAILRFQGDSDAMIVKGLIAIVLCLYNGLSAADVANVDAVRELSRLGLDEHLSSQRSNGVRAMVARIQDIATKAAG
ncbi:MAG: SufE family protein [Halocynthiibacter sp.]